MSTLGWILVAVLAWLALVGFIVLVVRGGAMADREQRAAAAYLPAEGADPTPEEWARAHQVTPLHRGSRLLTAPVPAFRFGSGPLAGVGLHTSRPWVQR